MCHLLLSQKQISMKASKVIILLIPLLFCQCASYKLYREDVYRNGKLVDRTTFKYEDGQLSSEVKVNYYTVDGIIRKSYSTTDYQVRKTDSGIDSIEMYYNPISDTSVIVRSYNPQGVIQSIKEYRWAWDGRNEISCELYDSNGNLIEEDNGYRHTWYLRDSLNRVVVAKVERVPYALEIDSTSYSFDGRYTTVIERRWNDRKGLLDESKSVYEPDINGLIIMDSTAQSVVRFEYELDGKGRIKSKTANYTYADGKRPDSKWKNEYRYDHKGRKTYTSTYFLTADPPYHIVTRKVYRLGRLIKKKEMRYQDGEKFLIDDFKFRYNLLGKLVEKKYEDERVVYVYKMIH